MFFCKALFNNNSASETHGKNNLFKVFNLEIFLSEEGKSALLAAIIIGLDDLILFACTIKVDRSYPFQRLFNNLTYSLHF